MQDLLTQEIDAFIYIPPGAAAAAVPTRLAREAGIPVINVDRFPEEEPGDTFIGGEGVNSSYEVCKYIIEKAGGSGKMAIIHGQKGTTPEVDRTEGCMKAIGEASGVEIVDQQWTNMWSADEGFSITQNLLQAHPDLKIIFGQADGIAMGAAKAVEGAGASGAGGDRRLRRRHVGAGIPVQVLGSLRRDRDAVHPHHGQAGRRLGAGCGRRARSSRKAGLGRRADALRRMRASS